MNETSITQERLQDLLCSAFEGGSNYWYVITGWEGPRAECKYPHIELPFKPGGAVLIRGFGSETYRLDHEAVQKGLAIMRTRFKKHYQNFLDENDDAVTGDVFLQCCLFGEVVYG